MWLNTGIIYPQYSLTDNLKRKIILSSLNLLDKVRSKATNHFSYYVIQNIFKLCYEHFQKSMRVEMSWGYLGKNSDTL